MMNVILETTFSIVEPGDHILAHKHVLHLEPNGRFCYNQVTSDGTGWQTRTFSDLEKATRYFLREVSADRKAWKASKGIRVVSPLQTAASVLKDNKKRIVTNMIAVLVVLSKARQADIDKLSTSERALITLMQQGGDWALRVYEALPGVIEQLAKRLHAQAR